MKTENFKTLILIVIILFQLTSCTKDSDVTYNEAKTTLLAEDFNGATTTPPSLTAAGWVSYAQVGIRNWSQASYKNDGYAQMSSYTPPGVTGGSPVNVTWLISPPINMDAQQGEKLNFLSCQNGFVKVNDNSLELFVTTNYDATNFANTNWNRIDFIVPNSETKSYDYLSSGILDLSSYTGTLRFALKYKGTSSQTGGYQVDKVRVLLEASSTLFCLFHKQSRLRRGCQIVAFLLLSFSFYISSLPLLLRL